MRLWQPRGGDRPVLRYFYRESDRPIVGSFDAWGTEPGLPWRDTERGVELAPDGQLLAFHGAPPTDKRTVVLRLTRGGRSRPRRSKEAMHGISNQGVTTGQWTSLARRPPRRVSPPEGCGSPPSGTSRPS